MSQAFRTIVKLTKPPFTITHEDRIMTIGSCFSENVGRCFEQYKFRISINPFGQQYNPYSIAHALHKLLSPSPYAESDLGFQNGLYYSYDHHGSFSGASKEDTLSHINTRLAESSAFLRQATVLFLTFGTAHYFRLRESGRVVSNCHKVPSSAFDMKLMTPDEIVKEFDEILRSLWLVNPALKIILTVSPVRYFAFGHFENSVSKGHLFSAIHTLREKHPSLYYFPAYELIIDDLRDYRFYKDDMLHPTARAIDYVWENLSLSLLPPPTQALLKDIDEIVSAAAHRPRHPHGEAHDKFVRNILLKIDKLELEHQLDFAPEKQVLRK